MEWQKKVLLKHYYKLTNDQKKEIEVTSQLIKASPLLYLKKRVLKPKYEPLIYMPLGLYLEMQKKKTGNPVYIIQKIFPFIDTKSILHLFYLNVVSVMSWVTKEIESINKIEKVIFNNKKIDGPDTRKLDTFGNYNIINALSGNDITKEKEMLKLPYAQCLQYLHYQKIKMEIQEDYMKKQNQKHKTKR